MKILLTAFEPFGADEQNASLEAAKRAAAPEECELIKLTVPVEFGTAAGLVNRRIDEIKPDAVLMLGQAGGREAVTPERVAINVMDAENPDNKGFVPKDEPVVPDGENALFTRLPIKAMRDAMLAEHLPAEISNTAGTYVCNSLMYGVLNHVIKHYPGMPAGFMHVPYFREQVMARNETLPFMELNDITRAVEICLKVLLKEMQ